MSSTKKKPQSSILLFLVSFGAIGAVLFTPALPSIQSFFHVAVGRAELTVTLFLVGYACGLLFYGPLANRFGRKPALYTGLCLAAIGSLLCTFSAPLHSFSLLLFARFLQALGACSCSKICFTMVAETYEQTDSTKMISRFLIAFAVMPPLAIAIGGWLTVQFGWPSCFYFLAVLSGIAIWLVGYLPETALSLDRTALRLSSIIHGYRVKLRNTRLLISGLMMGCGTAVIYLFASKAPFIGIQLIGLTPEVFGLLNLISSTGMLLGAFLAMRLAGYFHLMPLLLFAIIATIIATLSMLVPFIWGAMNYWSLFLPMVFVYSSEALVFANISSFGLQTAKNKSNASAMINFINISMAIIAVFLSGWIFPEKAVLLPLGMLFFFLLMFGLWCWLSKNSRNQKRVG